MSLNTARIAPSASTLLLLSIVVLGATPARAAPAAASADKHLNMSWFVFRDVNRNGVYDTGDRPYAGLETVLQRPDGSLVTTTSNRNGFANFRMSRDPELGDITAEGSYRLTASVPAGWEVTSPASVANVEFRYLDHSPAGIVAKDMPEPLGVAPLPTLSGKAAAAGRGYRGILATDPTGDPVPVEVDGDGRFRLRGAPGQWTLREQDTSPGAGAARQFAVQFYPVVLSRSALASATPIPDEHTITLGYDDLIDTNSVHKIPNGYSGLRWDNWIVTHNLFYGGAGYVNATVSSDYVVYNSSGHPGDISSDRPFDFLDTYIAVAWPAAAQGVVHVEGYRGDDLVYSDVLKLDHRIAVHFHANYLEITRLRIYSDIYWQVILDDSRFVLPR